jgi:endonuclease G
MKSFFSVCLFCASLILNAQQEALLRPQSAGIIIHHPHFSLAYSEEHEQAYWVFYELRAEELKGRFKRKDNFRTDASVLSGSASLSDYRASGYDRGHLAPAADMAFSEESMSTSFLMSNMSPQAPSFNRGVWKELEALFRDWALKDGSLYIVTGPVLKKGLAQIGANGVSVPELYYKIALDWDSSNQTAIAFLLPNKKLSDNLENYIVTIDSIEEITGIDFFAALDDAQEAKFESELSTFNFWEKKRLIAVGPDAEVAANFVTSDKGLPAKQAPSNSKYWLLAFLLIVLLIMFMLVYSLRKKS